MNPSPERLDQETRLASMLIEQDWLSDHPGLCCCERCIYMSGKETMPLTSHSTRFSQPIPIQNEWQPNWTAIGFMALVCGAVFGLAYEGVKYALWYLLK
jgi:hypothetical protein